MSTVHNMKKTDSYQDQWGQWVFKHERSENEWYDLDKLMTDDLLQKVVEEMKNLKYITLNLKSHMRLMVMRLLKLSCIGDLVNGNMVKSMRVGSVMLQRILFLNHTRHLI